MAEIVLEDLTKKYAEDAIAIRDLDLNIKDGEFMVFVGPSGCGKSTALRMIAGLETITDGEVKIGGKTVNDVAPKDRDIAMVFQNYALYPHMSVYDNMAFGLKLAKLEKSEIDKRVKRAADVLGLTEFLDRKPRALSGGQRQRVAMGRAIVREPQAFLMDEPLSNLDAKLRVQMRSEISRIQNDLNVTTIYVTHDQVEAMTMGDRVCVLKKGELQQVGTPEELFDHPLNLFVAGFIGSPSMNFATAKLEDAGGTLQFDLAGNTVKVSRELLEQRPALKNYAGREVIVGIRPQDFEDAELVQGASEGSRITAKLDLVEAIGTETLLHFTMDAPIALTDEMRELAEDVGGDAADNLERKAREGVNEFVAQVDPKSKLKQGQTAELIIDISRLHFFDVDTAKSIFDEREGASS